MTIVRALLTFFGCAAVAAGLVVAWDLPAEPPRRDRDLASAGRGPARRVASAETTAKARRRSPPGARASPAEQLVEPLLELMQQASADQDAADIARLRSELLALGEGAADPLLTRLASEGDTTRRDLLLDLLRTVPGPATEAQLIREARSAPAGSTRSIAMDALAARGSDEALRALADIASSDPELPSRPLIVPARRGLDDSSTELPDEVDYTPRMKAMVALAASEDDRAVPILLRILQREREESLRMRAAEHLGRWQNHRLVLPALRQSAAQDASRYVRLAALHALHGADDASLAELLSEISERDPDPGVRLLARRLLENLDATAR